MAKPRQRGVGYQGKDSTRPTQRQEGDLATTGGTAPGGVVAFMGAASQWATSNAAQRNNFPSGYPNVDPVGAAKMMHVGLADEAPAEKGDVPINPGLAPGKYRTGQDANYPSPDGKAPNKDPASTGGRPLSPNGRHRGESPEIMKQSRGKWRA